LPSNSPSVTQFLKKFKKEFESHKAAAKVAKRTNTTIEQVLADWETNKNYSCTLGSMLHKYIENYYSNKRVEFEGPFTGIGHDEKQKIYINLPKIIKHFQNFYKDHLHLLCIKSELVLGDMDDTRVCGTSDMLCYNEETDELEILDFKTNKKLKESKSYGNLLYPFDDTPQTNINEYTIQLNLYKFFIEKYTNLRISKLKLVWLHETNDNYKIIELSDIQQKIHQMVDVFKRNSVFAIA
jgi:hypothetical protein